MNIKKCLRNCAIRLFPNFYFYQLYIRYRHRWPNFKNPKDLSEIILKEVISHEIEKFSDYADKVEVRNYITKWGLGNYLPKIYGVWNSVDDINFDLLPNKFVLKTNHGCGDHQFCYDKNHFNINDAKKKLHKVLSSNYGGLLEPHYALIKPKVFAEELLEESGLTQPLDYKFMCCDGDVRFILFCTDRGSQGGVKFSAYSLDWTYLNDFVRGTSRCDEKHVSPPKDVLDEMIRISSIIAKKLPHVRVDLYYINGRIYIGELTMTPASGVMSYFTNKAVEFAGHIK